MESKSSCFKSLISSRSFLEATVFIKNMPLDMKIEQVEPEIRALFQRVCFAGALFCGSIFQCGEIVDIRPVMFRDGRFRGTCFVEFAEDSSVHKANMMDGSIIQEKHLTIRRARAQTKESTQKSSGKASRVKEESIQPKSNADFRKMLQSKKRKKSYYSSTGK